MLRMLQVEQNKVRNEVNNQDHKSDSKSWKITLKKRQKSKLRLFVLNFCADV